MTRTNKFQIVAICVLCCIWAVSCSARPSLVLNETGTSKCQITQDESVEFIWLKDLDLWMGKYEVSHAQFVSLFPKTKSQHQDYYAQDQDKANSPAVNVSWKQANKFCRILNKQCKKQLPNGYIFRLPSEEEWEAAAKCGTDRKYPWGNSWPPAPMADSVFPNLQGMEVVSFSGGKPAQNRTLPEYKDGWPSTCPMNKSGKNEWGIYGMAGNVKEWCEGWYDQQQKLRLLKGCSAWTHQAEQCDIEARDRDSGQSELSGFFLWGEVRNDGHNYSGFRVVIGKPMEE